MVKEQQLLVSGKGTIQGTFMNDVITGSAGNDKIYGGICTIEYYKKAISIIEQHFENPLIPPMKLTYFLWQVSHNGCVLI